MWNYNKVLFHGTIKNNYNSIKNTGLISKTGDFVGSVHSRDGTIIHRVYAATVNRLHAVEYAIRFHLEYLLHKPWPIINPNEIIMNGMICVLRRNNFTEYIWDKSYDKSQNGLFDGDWSSIDTIRPVRYLFDEQIYTLFKENGGFSITQPDIDMLLSHQDGSSAIKYANMINFASDSLTNLRNTYKK